MKITREDFEQTACLLWPKSDIYTLWWDVASKMEGIAVLLARDPMADEAMFLQKIALKRWNTILHKRVI